jgi:F-type H+-transporting ATPase subunit delta
MIYGSISRRYAKAIFDLAVEKNLLPQVMEHMEQFLAAWKEDEGLRTALTSPAVTLKTRRDIVAAVAAKAGLIEMVRQFLLLLVQKGRMESLELIVLTLRAMGDRKEGIVRGELVSAFPLDPPQLEAIQHNLEKKIGKKIVLMRKVDPDLIGGIVIKIGDKVIDGSVRSALEDMRKTLTGEMRT